MKIQKELERLYSLATPSKRKRALLDGQELLETLMNDCVKNNVQNMNSLRILLHCLENVTKPKQKQKRHHSRE